MVNHLVLVEMPLLKLRDASYDKLFGPGFVHLSGFCDVVPHLQLGFQADERQDVQEDAVKVPRIILSEDIPVYRFLQFLCLTSILSLKMLQAGSMFSAFLDGFLRPCSSSGERSFEYDFQ